MIGSNANALFLKKISPIAQKPWLYLFNKTLSSGCIGYYIKDNIWQTRIFLHNYFALLNNDSFPARWDVAFFSKDGKFIKKLRGFFSGPETTILGLNEIDGLDTYGITWVKISMNSKTYVPSDAYSSVFFSEYYTPGTKMSVLAHSLSGTLKASHNVYSHTGTGFTTPVGFHPYIFIGNACNFQSWGHGDCGDCKITIINHRGQKIVTTVSNIPQHGCRKIDLYSNLPNLEAHFENQPYVIEVTGNNLLAIPFLFQTNGKVVLAEHL